jgi:hypothetical protein
MRTRGTRRLRCDEKRKQEGKEARRRKGNFGFGNLKFQIEATATAKAPIGRPFVPQDKPAIPGKAELDAKSKEPAGMPAVQVGNFDETGVRGLERCVK